jgi:Ca2+-binding RTX toxin-like protein
MATTTTRPDALANIPDLTAKGEALLKSLTAGEIWDISGGTGLQYYFGNGATLQTDGYEDLLQSYNSVLNKNPDTTFYFAALTQRAYAMIDAVSDVDFAETTDLSEADHVLVSWNAPNGGLEGFFEFPGSLQRDEEPFDWLSLGALNRGLKVMAATPVLDGDGEYANWTVLHEIGHGLGLKHTHQERSGLPPLATVGAAMDNERYSVMSYNGSAKANGYGHAVSFMALDIAALQALYGAEDYATTDSSYTMLNAGGGDLRLDEGAVQIGRAYYSIWDSGGDDDQIDYGSVGKSVLINLNDATLDTNKPTGDLKALIAQVKITGFFADLSSKLQQEITDSWHHAGGFFSRVLNTGGEEYKGADGGFTIAHGAQIENANGGDMADLLIGNEGDNVLSGLAGNDSLLGGSGDDTLDGGAGRDRLDGGRGTDTLTGGTEADRFVFATGYGTDSITDFEAGDVIDLSRLKGFSNFGDLFNNHMADNAGDVVITVGTDVLVIEDAAKADLAASDFVL